MSSNTLELSFEACFLNSLFRRNGKFKGSHLYVSVLMEYHNSADIISDKSYN